MELKFGNDLHAKYPARRFQNSERLHAKKNGQADATKHWSPNNGEIRMVQIACWHIDPRYSWKISTDQNGPGRWNFQTRWLSIFSYGRNIFHIPRPEICLYVSTTRSCDRQAKEPTSRTPQADPEACWLIRCDFAQWRNFEPNLKRRQMKGGSGKYLGWVRWR